MSENRFEQHAEKLSRDELLEYYKDIDDGTILKKLTGRGAKLLSAPRGAGKSMLFKKTYYKCLDSIDHPLPVYTNYSQYFRVEDAGHNRPTALITFRRWVLSKIILSSINSTDYLNIAALSILEQFEINPTQLTRFVESLEGGTFDETEIELSPDKTCEILLAIAKMANRKRVILLLDDAAHAFTPEFQREFFDVFRGLNKFLVSPKAAVYPGVTSYGARFNVGHDAEIIPVGLEPENQSYLEHMIGLLEKRVLPEELQLLKKQDGLIELLAFAASGIPRAFILMCSYYIDAETRNPTKGASQNGWEAINEWNQYIETLYESISIKVPRFKNYIQCGSELYRYFLEAIKTYNYKNNKHSIYLAVEEKNSARYDMLIQFMEYAGILFRRKQISQGESGLFNRYLIHLGLQIQHKTLIKSRGRSYRQLVEFIQRPDNVNHRISYLSLLSGKLDERCSLELPPCPVCRTPRLNGEAKYCMTCGSRLSDTSIYSEIIKQPINVLKITQNKKEALLRSGYFNTLADLLPENAIEQLYRIDGIGRHWANEIWQQAQELTLA
ncbi:hypothetical protein GETHPA_24330 [Geothrix rubra]|uniref:Zinc ribbon domain-containing protein n=1 Tax=Geothrix rubra TaxID=2927977 RepID=A0ABQ5Q7X5_9BACT|nr:hypothetical protein [Geothrix rubra]GLH70900.1 hypothetical protein GETHPA_24330 [Geothrix rubra]